MIDKKAARYFELDSLRGIAALLVVIFHFTKDRPDANFLNLGVTGVDLFFIISGFVIFMTLEKTTDWKDFVVSRFSRLYPAYWTCVTLTTLLIVAYSANHHLLSWKLFEKYVANMTMFQQFLKVGDLDPPYWTMLVEMIFYLFMLIVFLCKKLKSIELIGAILLIPVCIYGTSWFYDHHLHLYHLLRFWCPLINHFPLFFAGILFYKVKREGYNLKRTGLLCACFICQLFLFDDGGRSFYFISFTTYSCMLLFYFVFFTFFIRNLLRPLGNSIFLFFGSISFSLYLFHYYLGEYIIIPYLVNSCHLNFWIATLIAMIIVITIAYFNSTYIEKPAMRFVRNKYKKKLAVRSDQNIELRA